MRNHGTRPDLPPSPPLFPRDSVSPSARSFSQEFSRTRAHVSRLNEFFRAGALPFARGYVVISLIMSDSCVKGFSKMKNLSDEILRWQPKTRNGGSFDTRLSDM
eukprot:scaffold136137_cov19-Tisochrysis_lutea.AAC.1